MKKIITLLVIFLFVHSFCLYADNAKSFAENPSKTSKKKTFGIKDRSFEIGLANINMNFANNFLSMKDIFKDVIVFDLDKLSNGLMYNFGADITPFYFSINFKKGWGFGLSTRVETIGILGISGKLLSISEAVNDKSDIGGALFASATVNTHFNIKKLKIKINPSLFYTLAYVTPSPKSLSGLTYTLDYSNGTVLYVDYDMRLYTGSSLEGNIFDITAKPGFDINIGIEYPLAKQIDIGIDVINIPIIASKVTDYTRIKGRVGSDQPITFFGNNSESFFNTTSETEKGKEEIDLNRPLKLIAHLDWRPVLGTKLLTITPVFGINLNKLYHDPFSFEGGLNASLNLANLFILKAGVNYTDRMFVNSISIALNFRAIELDIGADIRAQDFVQSWTGSGLGVNFGLKFGW